MIIPSIIAPVTGIGVSPFDRLGLEASLPGYKIITLKKAAWVEFFPELKNVVFSLDQLDPEWKADEKRMRSEIALERVRWDVVQQQISVINLLTYKPSSLQKEFQQRTGIRILNNSYELASVIENKVTVRKLFASQPKFPDFKIMTMDKLADISYEDFSNSWGDFVIQDSVMAGGKGTFFITGEASYKKAVEYLRSISSREIVISKFISGRNASVQACVTQYGIFSLPPQIQVINQESLTNTHLAGSDKFNGGQWSQGDFSQAEKESVKKLATFIGEELKARGYKGIFGIDLLITPDSTVHIIEINARLTGMTSVIANIQHSLGQIPLLLLHTLEHLDVEYILTPDEVEEIHNYTFGDQSYSYLLLFNLEDQQMTVRHTFRPGLYKEYVSDENFQRPSYHIADLQNDEELLSLDFPQEGECVKANARLGKLILRGTALDSNGNLSEKTKKLISELREML